MDIYSRTAVSGNNVELATTSKQHFNGKGAIGEPSKDPVDGFSQVLFNVVDQVNASQANADDLEQKMIMSPETVNEHEVMIAMEKARLSISYFKSITEKAIRAYNDIMTIR
jgi:flagellar hook-basal body complex protein FliE